MTNHGCDSILHDVFYVLHVSRDQIRVEIHRKYIPRLISLLYVLAVGVLSSSEHNNTFWYYFFLIFTYRLSASVACRYARLTHNKQVTRALSAIAALLVIDRAAFGLVGTMTCQQGRVKYPPVSNNNYFIYFYLTTRPFSGRKPPPTPKLETKVIRNLNPDFRINLDTDPDVRRICPKILWMHYLVGVSHLAKYGTNRPLRVWEMLAIVQKIPYSAMVKKMKKWSGMHALIRIITKS